MIDRKDILKRHDSNPILTPEQMPFPCYSVFNAGVTMFRDKVMMVLRIEKCDRLSCFHTATSSDGLHFEVNPEPIDYPWTEREKQIGWTNRFDMRLTQIEGRYIGCHAAHIGKLGCCIGMAETEDFVHFKNIYLGQPTNRNSVLFPEKINGLYARLDRPHAANNNGQIWVSYSPDLKFWGGSEPVRMRDLDWAYNKTGAGAVPIKTPQGWLEIYHGTSNTCSSENYFLGAMLLDLDDPTKVIAQPREFILAAEKPYECMGQVPNVVFTSGALEMPDGALNLYYAGADTRMCLAQTTVAELVEWCLR